MSLDTSKLQLVRQLADGGIQARCPACAETGGDRQGMHLRVYADGRFGCVVNRGLDGEQHRKRIFALAGKLSAPKPWAPRPLSVVKVAAVSVKAALWSPGERRSPDQQSNNSAGSCDPF